MNFSVAKVQDVTILTIRGDIWGGDDSKVLKDNVTTVLGQGDRKFVIDLGGTNKVNSAGLGVLLATKELVTQAGGILKICDVSERSRKVMTVSALIGEFDLSPTREDALLELGVTESL